MCRQASVCALFPVSVQRTAPTTTTSLLREMLNEKRAKVCFYSGCLENTDVPWIRQCEVQSVFFIADFMVDGQYSCLVWEWSHWGPSITEDGSALRKALQSNVRKLYMTLTLCFITSSTNKTNCSLKTMHFCSIFY